jgi:hypothetical protein
VDMDDDDFMGPVGFDLSADQRDIVSRAIDLAASRKDDAFGTINPLIAIMQWWEENVAAEDRLRGAPETILAEACRAFVSAHDKPA